jgi:hypothetical protein
MTLRCELVGIIEAVASLRKGIRCSELQKVHLKMAETAKKHVRDVKAAVKIEEIAPFWLCSPKYMYKIHAAIGISLISFN